MADQNSTSTKCLKTPIVSLFILTWLFSQFSLNVSSIFEMQIVLRTSGFRSEFQWNVFFSFLLTALLQKREFTTKSFFQRSHRYPLLKQQHPSFIFFSKTVSSLLLFGFKQLSSCLSLFFRMLYIFNTLKYYI